MTINVKITAWDENNNVPVVALPISWTDYQAPDCMGLYGGTKKGSGKTNSDGDFYITVGNIGECGSSHEVTVDVTENNYCYTTSETFEVNHTFNNGEYDGTIYVTPLPKNSSSVSSTTQSTGGNSAAGSKDFWEKLSADFKNLFNGAQKDLEVIGIIVALVIVAIVIAILAFRKRDKNE